MDYTEQFNNISENIRYDIAVIADYEISSVFIDGEEKIKSIFNKIEDNHHNYYQRIIGRKIKSNYDRNK